MFLMIDDTRLTSNEVVDRLRQHPREYYKRFKVCVPHSPGKTTSSIVVTPGITFHGLQLAAVEHQKRMRGRFQHSHKGKVKRRHRLVTSWLDEWDYSIPDSKRRLKPWILGRYLRLVGFVSPKG